MTRPAMLGGVDVEDYLSRLYLAMLRLAEPTRQALGQEGFDAEDLRWASAVLESRGLIEPSGAEGWEVCAPEVALPQMASAMEARARSSRSSAAELGVLWRQSRKVQGGNEFRGMEMLHGVPDIVRAVRSLQGLARSRLRLMLDDSPASREWLHPSEELPGQWSSTPAGATTCVVDLDLVSRPGVLAGLERRGRRGELVKVARNVPFSCVIADEEAALVDLSRHHPQGDGSFVVRRRPAVVGLSQMVEVAFAFSTELLPTLMAMQRPRGDRVPLDERDRRILGLLATGASDQLIARHTGVSTRTVERRIRFLMDLLGAATRFQAGVAATRRGWI